MTGNQLMWLANGQPCFHNAYLRFDRLADRPIVGLVRLHTVNAFMICRLFVSGCNEKQGFLSKDFFVHIYKKNFSCISNERIFRACFMTSPKFQPRPKNSNPRPKTPTTDPKLQPQTQNSNPRPKTPTPVSRLQPQTQDSNPRPKAPTPDPKLQPQTHVK